MWEWIIGGVVVVFVAVVAVIVLRPMLRERHFLRKYGDAEVAKAIAERRILQEMTREQLLDSWGQPIAREEKVTKTTITEVFKYRPMGRNRFRDKVTLKDGIVTGWDQK